MFIMVISCRSGKDMKSLDMVKYVFVLPAMNKGWIWGFGVTIVLYFIVKKMLELYIYHSTKRKFPLVFLYYIVMSRIHKIIE